jgi:hypothetical protein
MNRGSIQQPQLANKMYSVQYMLYAPSVLCRLPMAELYNSANKDAHDHSSKEVRGH